jgi:hypothetical protein
MHHAYARIVIGLGIVFSVLIFEPGNGAYIPTADMDAHNADAIAQAVASQSEPYCVALAVYFEGGSTFETEEGQRHIARVVVERGKANLRKWGGTNLCDVVFYKRGGVCQFSFACLPLARRTPRGGAAWERALEIAKEEIEGRSDLAEYSIRYYMNPTLTSDRNACRFRKEFVPVAEAGRHQFFREPSEAERAELTKSEPIECKRYEAALAAKKRAAKAAAERKKRRLAAIARKKKAKNLRYAGR